MRAESLADMITDVRQRTLDLVADLTDEEMLGPKLSIVNPPLWEIGHVAWFQEFWVLRGVRKLAPIRSDADSLYDSMEVAHDTRWDLHLPSRAATLSYLLALRDRVVGGLPDPVEGDELYFNLLSVFHEDMHGEAFTYTRQTHAYPPPEFTAGSSTIAVGAGPLVGDVSLPGGTFMLGADSGEGFVFDNEKWAHPVEAAPFKIARAAVTQSEFAAFVDDGGYRRNELWSEEGLTWRDRARAEHPVYWRKMDGQWQRRHFHQWIPLEPNKPVIHVNWHEAEAFCRWAGRRLPTEAEWEMAAAWNARTGEKLRYTWGNEPPSSQMVNMDWSQMDTVDVGALPEGDSPAGCRQMIGNVWEWTSSTFVPYPGFIADPYKDYSEPWFHTRKVLRGGCWATRAHLIRNTWRNFYEPDRRDVFAGFRTCALD